MMMIVFALGSDSGFQLGADGILDDYDDESGISVILWCIIFVFLLVVTIWFYVTQLTPRSVKCVDDEDIEDEEERVANKLLNHLGAGKSNYNSKPSSSNKGNDICRPSTSSQNSDNYEVMDDGEIRIHHSSYEWQDESSSKSKGNESGVGEMSDSLVRRPSMEEMSLIFPGFLPSITEEEEEEENQENYYKEEDDLFDPSVCKITNIEGDIVESCPNISLDSKVYEPSADVHSTVNNSDVKNLDQREESSKLVYGKDISGRQITNRKGKQPAQTSRVTAEIRLRTQNLSQVSVVSRKDDKSVHDETVQASKPSGSGPKESDVNENKVSVLKAEKTSAYSSQNTKSFSLISGSKTHKFDPMDQNLGSNTSRDDTEANKEVMPAGRKDFKADKNSRELLEDAKNELSISASLNSNCYVNRNSNEDIVCIETSHTNLQSEPDRDLSKPDEENNRKKESSAGSMSKKIDPTLSDGLKNTTFKDTNNMSNHLTHAWTFYSVLESTDDVNEINGDHKGLNSLIEKPDQTQEIPKIVVDSYEDGKISPNNINLENGTWTQLDGQIDSFETDIDVDDLDLEDEYEGNESEGELNMFLKRHVSVTDLDKVLSSNENAQDEDDFETEKFESELAEDGNLETIMRGINISQANKPVYTESSLDDIWDDDERCAKNGAVEHSIIETSEETSKTCSSENDNRNVSGTNEFFSRQSVWTTLDQVSNNSTKVKEDNRERDRQTKYPTENKRTENVVDAKKIISSKKVEEKLSRKTKDGFPDDANTEKNDNYSEVRSLKEKIPDLMRGSEEESISSGSITINEFKVVEVSESCEQVNKSGRTFHDGEKRKTAGVEKVNRYVYGEVMLEPITSQRKDSSQNISTTIADKQESAGGLDSSDFLKRTKPESTMQDSSSTEVKRIPELSKTEVLESRVVKDLESKVVVADETTKKRQEGGSVLDGRKENGEKVEQGSGHIGIIRPVSPRRRDDVIYGRRKTKKDGSGKRAEFILRLNESSRNREHVTSPYTSDSDDSLVSWNSTASDVTATLSADQTCEDGVNLRGEHLPKAIKEDKHSDVTQSSHEVKYSTVMPSDKGINKSSTSIDSTTQVINKVTAQEGVTVVTQSSATIEPEVNQPLESAELPSGKNEPGATERQEDSDRGSVTYEEEDANRNYRTRVERRDVQPKFEKSFVVNPEKKELQTLITIDQVPDTHIGLKICMTGRFDIEQKKTITGLEKAEQIVANRMRRIEAEKKAAEERKGKGKVDEEASKETKSRKDYVPRKARYDETRYRRIDRGRNTGVPVDERITPEEPIPRNIQWNDFKLDDVLLEEVNVSEKYQRKNDGSDDIDFHISDYEHKPNIKKAGSAERMVTEDVISETFSPREMDWTLLELCDTKSNNKEIAENNNGIADVSSSGKKQEETFYSNLDSDVNKYKDNYRKISLDTDERKESTKVIALEKLSTQNLQKEIPSEKSSLIESSTAHVQENKENTNKHEQYNQKTRLYLDRKKRSDVLKKKISDKLSNMDLEVGDESEDQASTVSPPSSEPDFPVRLTKSFSELRSMNKEKHDAGISKSNERISDLPSPRDPGVSTSEDDEVFTDSQGKVFKTKVTVDEVRGNKRRITILNIRKKSPGSTRWRSLNDIDSLSTVQKQIFRFTSVSSMPDEDKGPQVSPDDSQSGKIKDTIFAVSGSSPTDELDSANKSEEKRPKTTPSKAPQESYGGRISPSEENFVPSAHGVPASDLSYEDKRKEDKDTKARSISPKETMFVASPQSPTPSSDTGYHSKDEKMGLQRQSSLSPVTVQASRSSPTGRIFALSRHSPTPLSDSERKTREKITVERQSSLSPETVQTSRRVPAGTIFALSRHSPTPISDSEKRRQDKSSGEEKMVPRNSSLEKQSSTERSSRYGVSGKGTFFAVSRYSPASSDTENQGPKVQPKYQASGPSTKAPAVPIRSSSKHLEERSSKVDSVRRSQDEQLRKGLQETLRPKVHEKVNETRKEELESAPGKTTKMETTFPASGKESTSSEWREVWRKEESSSSSTLTKLSSTDDRNEKDSTMLSSDSDSEYRITRDGWLEKIERTSSSSNSDVDQDENKIVKVTDLDSLVSGVTSSESFKKSQVVEKSQTTSLETSVTTEYDRNASNSESAALLPSSTKLQSSQHTRITSTGVQETDLDALFAGQEPGDSAPVQKATAEETVESRTSLIRKTVVNRSGKILVTEENYVTSEKQQPVEDVPVTMLEADRSQDAPVIKAITLSESPAFGDLDDEVFTKFPVKLGVHQNGYRVDGTCSSDADSETSSLNSVPLKPKSRHTRSSLEAVKTSIRPLRSSLSSDSSAAATPIPSERSDTEFDPFSSLPSSTSTPDRNKRNHPEKGSRVSRKTTKESGHHMRQITAEGDGLQIDSSDGAAQRITRAYSESLMGETEFRRSAFTPVRNREKERSNSQDNILSRIPDEQDAIRYNDTGTDLNTERSFKELVDSHKSMPDLHKPHSESDAQTQKVPYHSRLSAHTRLWLSQTAGIDTSDLCKDDSFGSEIFLFPSNRFQPGKSVDASFLSFASDTDDVPDDVSTRPSSPMSEFSFAGEAPFGGDYQGDVIVVTCGNHYCGKDEIVRSQDKTSFTSCPSCFTYYCSNECRRAHWREHKKVCYFGRINSYMRSFVYFCHKKENLNLLLSKIGTKNFSSRGRGCVMVTFASPKQARKFMTSGCVLLPSPPSFSTVRELQQEGVISKHKVNLIQQVKDYDPNQELVLNLAIVAGKVDDLPLYPVPRHKLGTVLQCIRIPLSESLIQRPKPVIPDTNRETKVFYLPKCSRHEFVNDMEARRHYCRNISKSLKQYGIRMKKDYPEAYDNLCLYVEKNVPFKPLTVYGNKDSKIVACKIMPEGYTSTTLI